MFDGCQEKTHAAGSSGAARLQHADIALLRRILAVAEVFDSLVCDRPHRKGLSVEKVLSELEEQAGEYFDPDVVKALGRLRKAIRIPLRANSSCAGTPPTGSPLNSQTGTNPHRSGPPHKNTS